jgi:pimeloyl-ACP methyl ester carboxylesterase
MRRVWFVSRSASSRRPSAAANASLSAAPRIHRSDLPERLSVPHAGHLLMVQNPKALAQGLHDFISRHPTGEVGELPPRSATRHASGNMR